MTEWELIWTRFTTNMGTELGRTWAALNDLGWGFVLLWVLIAVGALVYDGYRKRMRER